MNRQNLNLILLGTAMALGALVYFTQGKDAAQKNPPLTVLKPDALTHVVLSHPKAPDIVLDKKDGKWVLSAPVQVAADQFEINSLLNLAIAEVHSSIDSKDVKLANLGLDPPGFSLMLNQQQLNFGGVQPYNYRRYVETGGKINLIDDPPASALDADYSDLVAKTLLPDGAQLASVTVPGLKVYRSADDKAWIAEPADAKAGADELQKFIDAWTSARALWNAAAPPPPADNKLVPVPQTAVLTLKDGKTLTFDITGRDPQLVLERPDLKVQYSLAKSDVDKLLKLP